MKKLIFIIALVGISSCNSNKNVTAGTDATAKSFVIEDLTRYNAEDLKKAYPDANFKEDIGMFEEGTEERAYIILYPDTPNELHITWENEEKKRMNDIRFTENGKWKSSTGIKVGTTYEELVRLNENPVSFYGFGWDYSGAVMWNNGKLEDTNLRIFLAPGNSPEGKFYVDHIVEATPEEIAALNLTVQTVLYKLE